jgi:hypothetical protein
MWIKAGLTTKQTRWLLTAVKLGGGGGMNKQHKIDYNKHLKVESEEQKEKIKCMLTFTAFMICHHQYLVHTDG